MLIKKYNLKSYTELQPFSLKIDAKSITYVSIKGMIIKEIYLSTKIKDYNKLYHISNTDVICTLTDIERFNPQAYVNMILHLRCDSEAEMIKIKLKL